MNHFSFRAHSTTKNETKNARYENTNLRLYNIEFLLDFRTQKYIEIWKTAFEWKMFWKNMYICELTQRITVNNFF